MTDTQPTITEYVDRVTGKPATAYTPPEDRVPVLTTLTDPAQIRATDEPDERGDFPCCSGARAAGGVDPKALAHNLTTAHALIEAKAQLESVRHLLQLRSDALARVTREADALRARLAAVEALGDSNPDHADTCGSMLTPGAGYPCSCWQADLRAALAVTTGEGEHVAREVFTADGIPFVRCSCTNAKSPTASRWLAEHVPNGGVAELQAVVKRQAEGAKA